MATIILNVSIYLLLSNNVKWIKFSIEIFFRFCWLVFKCVYGRLKNFNSILEDLHRTQMQWTIWDTDLRDAVRLQVAEVLLPAYRSFIKRYRWIHPFFFPIIICLKWKKWLITSNCLFWVCNIVLCLIFVYFCFIVFVLCFWNTVLY